MHDQNFKNLILDYPVQALEFFAGEEAGSSDLFAIGRQFMRLYGISIFDVQAQRLVIGPIL